MVEKEAKEKSVSDVKSQSEIGEKKGKERERETTSE